MSLVLAGVYKGIQDALHNRTPCPFECGGYLEVLETTGYPGQGKGSADISEPAPMKLKHQVVCSINPSFHQWIAVSIKAVTKEWRKARKLPIRQVQLNADSIRRSQGIVKTAEDLKKFSASGNLGPKLKQGKPFKKHWWNHVTS